MRHGYVYILVNRKNGTIYVGCTSDLQARLCEHRERANPKSFTARYGVAKLAYYEYFHSISEARVRERALKRYKRSWKVALIEAANPDWRDIPLDHDD